MADHDPDWMGPSSAGQPHYGQQQPPHGQSGYGQTGYGPEPFGPPGYGPAPYGAAPYGPTPYGPQYGQVPYGWTIARPTNGMAIASLVLGLLWVYWIGSILALVFGYVARSQIRQRGEAGGGMAIAGIVLGYIGLGVPVLVLLFGFAFRY